MKIQIQAGLFYIYGKPQELAKIITICEEIQDELGDDMYFADVSEGDKVVFECGYKHAYYTIKEIKELFQFCKAKVK